MSDTADILRRVLERLGPNGENWCQGYDALTKEGLPAYGESDLAVAWSLPGALMAEDAPLDTIIDASIAIEAACRENIEVFNDTHTWPEVKAALEAAIEKLRCAAGKVGE